MDSISQNHKIMVYDYQLGNPILLKVFLYLLFLILTFHFV